MATDKLEVEIGVEIKGLKKGIAQAKKEMQSLVNEQNQLDKAFEQGIITEKEYKNATDQLNQSFVRQQSTVKKNTQSINTYSNATKKVVTSTKNIGTAVGVNATPALQEFSRVIQDAPYGIQGVGNNITQLTAQFGYLSKQAGGTKKAFGAMLGALTGPAGVLFAVSAVTSALTVYGDEILNFITGTNDATKEAEDFNTALKEQKDLIDAVSKGLSDKAKVDQLRVQAGDITEEEAFKARQADLVALLQSTFLQEEEWRKKGQIARDKANKARKKGDDEAIKKYEEALTESSKRIAEIEKQRAKINLEITTNALRERIRLQKEETEYQKDELKKREENYAGHLKIMQGLSGAGVSPMSGGAGVAESPQLMQLIDPAVFYKLDQAMRTGLSKAKTTIQTGLTEIEMITANFNQSMSELWSGGLTNIIVSSFNSIGQALANGGNVIESLGKTLLSSLGQMLVQYGTMLITYAKLVAAKGKLDVALAVGGPAAIAAGTAGIGIGIAAIAAGAALSAAAGAIGTGGGSGGSVSTPSAPSTQSFSSGNISSGGLSSGNVVFEIQGTKLVGVLSNTLKQNRSLGGTNNLLFS